MRKLLILLISVLILAPAYVSAQTSLPVPVEISKDKVRIDGAIYYVHLVKQGQTIFSISKAYDIPISDIEAANPSAKNGLKAGAFLYIPTVTGSTPYKAEKQTVPAVSAEKDNTRYKYKEEPAKKTKKKKSGEDASGYKYRYRRTDPAPSAAAAATAAATVTTSAVKTEQAVTEKVKTEKNKTGKTDKSVKTEKMVSDDSEYEEDIDPDMAYKKAMSAGATSSQNDVPARTAPADVYSAVPVSEAAVTASVIPSETYEKDSRNYQISLVLPFGKSARYGVAEEKQCDFYSGALLALYQLREQYNFQKYRMEVIDLDKWNSVEEMLNDSRIGESDLIIGPIIPNDVEPVAEFAKEHRIPMVSPLDIKTSFLVDDNPFLFIYPSSSETVQKRLLQRFTDCHSDETVIVISEKGKGASPIAENAFRMLDSLGIQYRDYSYAILQNQNVTADLKSFIPEENTTPARILVASEDEAFVADAMRNLNVMVTTEKRNIYVFGMPKWRNFESVQLEYLHHLGTHISLSYYLDYNSTTTSSMTKKFEEVFHTSPTPFAYQGYDITRFFIESLESFGPTFPTEIVNSRYSLIQTDVEFIQKNPDSGFINSAVRDIVYRPDWTIECE